MAIRKRGEYYLGYVFTDRPIKIDERLIILVHRLFCLINNPIILKIGMVEDAYSGGLAFGLTSWFEFTFHFRQSNTDLVILRMFLLLVFLLTVTSFWKGYELKICLQFTNLKLFSVANIILFSITFDTFSKNYFRFKARILDLRKRYRSKSASRRQVNFSGGQ